MGEPRPPIASWDTNMANHKNLVWRVKFADRYQIEVQRTGAHTGDFVIYDHGDNNKELYRKSVLLLDGALHGPDIDDIHIWQREIRNFFDKK